MASASIIMEEDSGNHYLNMLMQSQSILASMDGEAVIDAEICNVSSVEIGKINLHNCESCKKTYKTKRGYDRHVINNHSIPGNLPEISDADIFQILKISLNKLGNDHCYPVTARNAWLNYTLMPNISLNAKIKIMYNILATTSNAERYYEQFYCQILSSPTFFPGLQYILSVELLRTTCDKILGHYKNATGPSKGDLSSLEPITTREIDALEYLGGYVIHNIEKKLTRNKNDEGLVILKCFKSQDVEGQQLVDLLSRGGLIGISVHTRSMFLMAEKVFRVFIQRENPQKMNFKAMLESLMSNVEIVSCINIATQDIINKDQEVVSSVAECMFMIYLRVRSFSHVRDLVAEKKREKKEALKEKSLRKSLKVYEQTNC